MSKLTAERMVKILQGDANTTEEELKEFEQVDDSFKFDDGSLYQFTKAKSDNKMWEVDEFRLAADGTLDSIQTGFPVFSFDKEKIYYFSLDYPQALTAEEKRLFDKENPFWAKWYQEES